MPARAVKPTDLDQRSSPSIFKRMGIYLPAMIVLGLAVPVMIYLGVMQLIGWRTPVFGANGVMPYMTSSGGNVILYASPNTTSYFAGISGNYESLLVPWRAYFLDRKMPYKEIQDIAQLRKNKGGVLVLPAAVSLSDEERAEIQDYQSRGGAILTTWATGTRNNQGGWSGWGFLDSLGAKVVGELPADADANQLVLNGESPVSHTHGAGQRLWMGKTSEKLLRAKGEMVAGRFMNWARVVDDERRSEGAVIFSEPATGAGRVAYFAFAESAWESRPLLAYGLIDDTIQWLQRAPAIVLAAWPNGKRAAQAIEMDTEEGFANALHFSSMMDSLDYPATFYVLTSVATRFPEVLIKLASDFGLGYHGDVHDGFKDQSEHVQTQRIKTMQSELASVLPDTKGYTGFRAPTEGYDATTEKLLQRNGIRHHVADPSRSEARLPVVAKINGIGLDEALIVLPRTQRDDINLATENPSAEQMTKALIDDADLVLQTGALGLLSIHSQNFSADGTLTKAMPGLLVHLKQRREKLWLASTDQIADWWRDRERIRLSSRNVGKRLEFNITITGRLPLRGASMVIMLPKRGGLPKVQSTKIGFDQPRVTRIDDYRVAVVFDALNPGDHVYQATFDL